MSQKPSTKDSNKKAAGENTNIPCALSFHKELVDFNVFLSTLPVMAHSINREGIIQSANDVWLIKMGYKREEVIGRKSTEFLTPESKEYAEKKA